VPPHPQPSTPEALIDNPESDSLLEFLPPTSVLRKQGEERRRRRASVSFSENGQGKVKAETRFYELTAREEQEKRVTFVENKENKPAKYQPPPDMAKIRSQVVPISTLLRRKRARFMEDEDKDSSSKRQQLVVHRQPSYQIPIRVQPRMIQHPTLLSRKRVREQHVREILSRKLVKETSVFEPRPRLTGTTESETKPSMPADASTAPSVSFGGTEQADANAKSVSFGGNTTPAFGLKEPPATAPAAPSPTFGDTGSAPPAFGSQTGGSKAPPSSSKTVSFAGFGSATPAPSTTAGTAGPSFGAADTKANASATIGGFGSKSDKTILAVGLGTKPMGKSSTSAFGGVCTQQPGAPSTAPATTSFRGFGSSSGTASTAPTPSFGSQSSSADTKAQATSFTGFGSQSAAGAQAEPQAAASNGFGTQSSMPSTTVGFGSQTGTATASFGGFGSQPVTSFDTKSSSSFGSTSAGSALGGIAAQARAEMQAANAPKTGRARRYNRRRR